MVEKNGQLYFGTKDGWIYCLNSLNGDIIWEYRISDGLINTLAPIGDSGVLVTAADGKVSLLSF